MIINSVFSGKHQNQQQTVSLENKARSTNSERQTFDRRIRRNRAARLKWTPSDAIAAR